MTAPRAMARALSRRGALASLASGGLVLAVLGIASSSTGAAPTLPRLLETNREWKVLPPPDPLHEGRKTLQRAAELLPPKVTIEIADVAITRGLLLYLARTSLEEPLTRRARERMKLPVDVIDLCRFLDDVISKKAWTSGPVVLTPSRARKASVLLHPDEVFRGEERRYGEAPILIDPPVEDREWTPPKDGAPLGPEWHARYPNPGDEEGMLAALEHARPQSDFGGRVRSLLRQLREHGVEVDVESTVRRRERGYLMYGAFWLSRAKTARDVKKRTRSLDRLRRRHRLRVPITWRHPKGWRATIAAAQEMSEAYAVVYATRSGALRSNHYDAKAIDFVAASLPRRLTLTAPDGATRSFDLAGAEEPRDLNLTPRVIEWIEEHFVLQKRVDDYPHWNDHADDD